MHGKLVTSSRLRTPLVIRIVACVHWWQTARSWGWEEGVEGDHHLVGEGLTEEAVEAAEGAEDEYEFNRILRNRNEKYTSLVTTNAQFGLIRKKG